MKIFFAIFFTLIIFSSVTCAAENPVRIARLPIIFQSSIPDLKTCAELETKIERAIHIPLNQTLQVAEYLSPDISTQALNEVWQKLRSQNKKSRLKDAMKPFAEKINADIVVCPILLDYNQYINNLSSFGEIFLYSYARVELIVYDRRADNLIDKKTSQFYNDVMSTTGTVNYLAKRCFDKVIDITNLHQLIMSVGK